jgi:hypothetical protein
MNISDCKMSAEELQRLMPVFQKFDPVWSKRLQRDINYIREAADQEGQIDMFDILRSSLWAAGHQPLPERASGPQIDYAVAFYQAVRRQIRDAICGKNGIYRKERRKIESSTEAFITTLVPVVLSAAHWPASMAGVATVIVLLISKIGIRSFCESTAPSNERKLSDVPKRLKKPSEKRAKNGFLDSPKPPTLPKLDKKEGPPTAKNAGSSKLTKNREL